MIDLKEIKNKIKKKENIYYLLIIVVIFLLDRLSKVNIINNFIEQSYYINDFINLDLVWNTGIGFGLFSSSSDILYNFITILILVVVLTLFYLILFSNRIEKIIYSFIAGGALGNFYDRIFYKAVPDFIDLHYNNFHWFTFNIADIFITIGLITLIVCGSSKVKKNEKI